MRHYPKSKRALSRSVGKSLQAHRSAFAPLGVLGRLAEQKHECPRLGHDNRSQWRAALCPTIGAVADRRRFRIDVQMTPSRSDSVHRFLWHRILVDRPRRDSRILPRLIGQPPEARFLSQCVRAIHWYV